MPENLQVTRPTPDAIHLNWEIKKFPIAEYRILYSDMAVADMSLWKFIHIAASDEPVLTDLHPALDYVVRVQAQSIDGRLGPMSEIKVARYSPPSEFS